MIRINLLKAEKKEIKDLSYEPQPAAKEKKGISRSPLILILLLLVCAVLHFNQKSTLNRERSLLDQARQEKRQLQSVLTILAELEEQKSTFQRKISLINRLKSHQQSAVTILDELSRRLPDWVWLTETAFKDQKIWIKGKALTNNLIADFISNLEDYPNFSRVNFISSTQQLEKGIAYFDFSLTTDYILPEPVSPQREAEDKGDQR